MFKKIRVAFLLVPVVLAGITASVQAQSTPSALVPAIQINRLMTIHNGAIRLVRDPVSGHLFYIDTGGNLYEVLPGGGTPYDTLVFTSADHGVQYVQGMTVYDSTLYISGNNNSTTPLTTGIIVRGVLQPNGSRIWSTVMETDPYETADYFDHLFSGLVLTPDGDSIIICSGARGDHGEIQDRYGAYPGLRNVPLTTNIYIVPTHDSVPVVLQNDSAWLAASIYLYARGVRNTFDMAYDGGGHLFGVENSGDRDHNEEMNWLQRGHHYGFPWVMGDTENPQQDPSFDPNTDPLINHYSRSWRQGFWNNDPAFPPPPTGLTFDAPIQNAGPDCDKFRDSLSGNVLDASDLGITMGTFTAHRSPLGLVFDKDSILHSAYRGDGFMLSWTKGYDSCGCTTVPDTGIGPFVDPSQDLVHLDLSYDSLIGNFRLSATRIVADFEHPVDAEMDSNKIYVLENGYGGTSGLYEVTLPVPVPCSAQLNISIADPCIPGAAEVVSSPSGSPPYTITWYDSLANQVQTSSGVYTSDTLHIVLPGMYSVVLSDSAGCTDSATFAIDPPPSLTINSVSGTTCIGCSNGEIQFSITGGTAPFNYSINPVAGSFAGQTVSNLPSGSYLVCATDTNGCPACDTATVPEDPTMRPEVPGINFSVFPNPSTGRVTLSIRGNINSEFNIRLTDLAGRLYKTSRLASVITGEARFDTGNLVPGYYIAELRQGTGTIRRSFIVTR